MFYAGVTPLYPLKFDKVVSAIKSKIIVGVLILIISNILHVKKGQY